MKKFGTRLLTAVVASSMIVTPVFAAPSVDDLKENKAAKESEVSSLQDQLTDIMSKLGDLEESLIEKGEEITKAEEDLILRFLNQTDFQKTILIRRGNEIPEWGLTD